MKRWLFALTVPLLFVTSGCAVHSSGWYAPMPPPPPRMEHFGMAPRPGLVWVPGYWGWRGRDYNWVQGQWTRPPHRRGSWVPGSWAPRGRGYHYRPGYWR